MVKKKRVPIIFEDDAIIVCEKPAGMPVQSDHTRDLDVLTTLKHHIFEEQAGEEEPYLPRTEMQTSTRQKKLPSILYLR